jgi:hypothetical protein
MEVTMTNGPIDRKLVQKIKMQTEHNERLMGRTIFTALATCGTLVGWMFLANPTPLTPQTAVAAAVPTLIPTDIPPIVVMQPTAALVAIDYAPIPTLQALPTQPPLPTLRVYKKPQAAAVNPAPAQSVDQPVPTNAPDAPAPTAAVDALPALRVIVQPTVAPVVAAPRPGKPAPGGGGGGARRVAVVARRVAVVARQVVVVARRVARNKKQYLG